jgi:hypothetical protein
MLMDSADVHDHQHEQSLPERIELQIEVPGTGNRNRGRHCVGHDHLYLSSMRGRGLPWFLPNRCKISKIGAETNPCKSQRTDRIVQDPARYLHTVSQLAGPKGRGP